MMLNVNTSYFIPQLKKLAKTILISWVQDTLSEYENDDIAHAIALSLSEEEQKKAKAIG